MATAFAFFAVYSQLVTAVAVAAVQGYVTPESRLQDELPATLNRAVLRVTPAVVRVGREDSHRVVTLRVPDYPALPLMRVGEAAVAVAAVRGQVPPPLRVGRVVEVVVQATPETQEIRVIPVVQEIHQLQIVFL